MDQNKRFEMTNIKINKVLKFIETKINEVESLITKMLFKPLFYLQLFQAENVKKKKKNLLIVICLGCFFVYL